MLVRVVTPPDPILDVATARGRLGIPATTDDATVTAWVAAATQAIDGPTGWLNRAIGAQMLELSLPGFPGNPGALSWDQRVGWQSECAPLFLIALPYPEIIEVDSVAYTDASGALQTVDASVYDVAGGILVPKLAPSWPVSRMAPGSVKVTYKAGYTTVPETIKQAVLLSVSQMRSMQGRDPMLTTDTVYGIGSKQYAPGGGTGFVDQVRAMLDPFRVVA